METLSYSMLTSEYMVQMQKDSSECKRVGSFGSGPFSLITRNVIFYIPVSCPHIFKKLRTIWEILIGFSSNQFLPCTKRSPAALFNIFGFFSPCENKGLFELT